MNTMMLPSMQTDKTLSIEDVAADAKAVGDNISQLQNDMDTKANKTDVLSLEEIQASTDLSGKIASASSLKNFATRGYFVANLSVGNNQLSSLGVYTSKVVEGTLPTSKYSILNVTNVPVNNNFLISFHFDTSGASLHAYTNYAQQLTIDWIQFN